MSKLPRFSRAPKAPLPEEQGDVVAATRAREIREFDKLNEIFIDSMETHGVFETARRIVQADYKHERRMRRSQGRDVSGMVDILNLGQPVVALREVGLQDGGTASIGAIRFPVERVMGSGHTAVNYYDAHLYGQAPDGELVPDSRFASDQISITEHVLDIRQRWLDDGRFTMLKEDLSGILGANIPLLGVAPPEPVGYDRLKVI